MPGPRSARGDTAREVGGALGVAVVGSIVSSIYRSHLSGRLPSDMPTTAASVAHDSLGAALQVSTGVGPLGAQVADAARSAFVDAMSRASIVTAAIAAIGALVAWRYLPARAVKDSQLPVEPSASAAFSAPWYIRACACTYGYSTCDGVVTASDGQDSCSCETNPDSTEGPSTDGVSVRDALSLS